MLSGRERVPVDDLSMNYSDANKDEAGVGLIRFGPSFTTLVAGFMECKCEDEPDPVPTGKHTAGLAGVSARGSAGM